MLDNDKRAARCSSIIIISALASLTLDRSLILLAGSLRGGLAIALGRASLLLRRALILGVVGFSSVYTCVSPGSHFS